MNKLVLIPFILSFFLSLNTIAQMPSIQLDRPDQTECPFIVPKKYIQVENGLTFEKISKNQKFSSLPTSLWKYGLNEHFEFRLITELVTSKMGSTKYTGINPITLGFKTSICKEKGIIPLTSFIGHFTTASLGSKAFRTNFAAPSFRFLMQHTISNKVVIAYNLGAEWDGINPAETYIYTLTTGVSFTDKWGGYVEMYGYLPKNNSADHRCDGGLTYLINNDFILDLSGGYGLSKVSPQSYFSFGFSYRFKAVK